jgi:hypothetical protein
MPEARRVDTTYTVRLSREIDTAYQALPGAEADAQERLYKAFLAQARNVTGYFID